MKQYLFIILLVGVCIGQRDYKDLKIPNNNDDPYYNTWGRLINQQGKLVEHMEDITAMLKPFRISGNYDESDLANSVHNSISIIHSQISSICAILSIMTDILNVDRGTRETSCNDLPSALHKKSAKTLLEEIKDFQEDIEFEINHLNENATHSENIQLVSTMNEVKKTYRVILKVL